MPCCLEFSSVHTSRRLNAASSLCLTHSEFSHFLDSSAEKPIFISLSSVGSMGYMKSPKQFLEVLRNVVRTSNYRFIMFSAGYEALDAAIEKFTLAPSSTSKLGGVLSFLYDRRLLCFSGEMPYKWLFPRCAAVVHHGGSGSTAAALHAGVPQVICPFILDQFYWAERMHWLGVAPEPLKTTQLVPDNEDDNCIQEAANAVVTAINGSLSPQVKLRAAELATRLAMEQDGVSVAVDIIKKEILHINADVSC